MSGAIYHCRHCGSTDVHVTAWVDANTGENDGGESPTPYTFCGGCQVHGLSVGGDFVEIDNDLARNQLACVGCGKTPADAPGPDNNRCTGFANGVHIRHRFSEKSPGDRERRIVDWETFRTTLRGYAGGPISVPVCCPDCHIAHEGDCPENASDLVRIQREIDAGGCRCVSGETCVLHGRLDSAVRRAMEGRHR